jgi:hypothetical protein
MSTTDILTLFCPVKLSLRQFVKVSGGMQGGSAPPAFQRAEQQRLEEKKKAMIAQGVVFSDDEDPAHGTLSITQKAPKKENWSWVSRERTGTRERPWKGFCETD